LEPSFLSIDDLNFTLQTFFINNDLYCIDSVNQQRYYFLDIQTNSSLYKVQISAFKIEQNFEGTLDKPVDATWDFDGSVPSIKLSHGLGILMGFSDGIYPSPGTSVSTIVLSTQTPQLIPILVLLLKCNLIFSQSGVNDSISADVIFSKNIDVSFGSPINVSVSNNQFISCSPGIYKHLSIELYDQDFRGPLTPIDLQCCFSLTLRRKKLNPLKIN
jgi:hypothetical protein